MTDVKFIRKTSYYPEPTHEFNLPAGWSCPFAGGCMTKADKDTGKIIQVGEEYRCYAAVAERFPSVRDYRWNNFLEARVHVAETKPFDLPKNCKRLRIHASGDFFSQNYFNLWLVTAWDNPGVQMWAFTKSIGYWVERDLEIPPNLVLTASTSSKQDDLTFQHNLRTATVYDHVDDVPEHLMIDTDDTLASKPGPSFALVENFTKEDNKAERIQQHNERARQIMEGQQ